MLYNVSYDLSEDNDRYAELESAIMELGPAVRCLQSTWLLISNLSANAIREALTEVIGEPFHCLITEVPGRNNAWSLLVSRGVRDWRRANGVEME